MTDDSYFFVSRLNKNAENRTLYSNELPEELSVISDKTVINETTQNRAEIFLD